jgi:hypothetical protein
MNTHHLTPIQIGLIRRAISQNGLSAKYVARMFCLPMQLVEAVMAGKVVASVPMRREETEEERTNGQAHFLPYLIGRKPVDEPEWLWRTYPGETPEAGFARRDKAREAYDRGEVDMFQARSSGYFFLYSVPRQIVDQNRRPYFSVIHGDP